MSFISFGLRHNTIVRAHVGQSIIQRWSRSEAKSLTSRSNSTTMTTTTKINGGPPEPTIRQLRIVALRSAMPMVGFGFMDNLVMINAGEAIDMSIGVAFGLSTFAAAGFGQCVSDVAGITCGGVVDATVAKLHLPRHGLTQSQLDLRITRLYSTIGGCIGVVFGCLLGMSCLLFMDTKKAERAKKAKELHSIFESILQEGHQLVNAERATFWMYDEEKDEVWSYSAEGLNNVVIHASATASIAGRCVKTGEVWNVPDAYECEWFDEDIDKSTGFKTKSTLAVPVKDDVGKTIGAIQVINKRAEDGKSDGVFSKQDEKILLVLSSHVSTFTRIVNA